MSIFDDFIAKSKQALESAGSNVGDYLISTVTDPFIKLGQPAGGDPAPGQYGYSSNVYLQPSQASYQSLAPAAAPGTDAKREADMMKYALMGLGGLVVVVLLLKRR